MPNEQTCAPESVSVGDRILDAAEQVVARDGVSNLTLDAVAKQAGVSKGGLLYHYRSKSALVIAVVERLAQRCEARHADVIAAQERGPGSFTGAYLACRNRSREPQQAPVQTALLAAAGTDPEYLAPFRTRLSEWQRQLEHDGIDPAVASIVRLAIDGLCLDELLGMPVPTGELRQRIIEKLEAMTHPAKE